jgi:hypothetical protein
VEVVCGGEQAGAHHGAGEGQAVDPWHAGAAPGREGGALERASAVLGLGLGEVDASLVPPRRLAELARYGMEGKAALLRRHPDDRRRATLVATVAHLQTRAVDDALDLLDVLVTSRLLARAERDSNQSKVRTWPRLGKASVTVAAALGVLLEVTGASEDLAEQARHDGLDETPISLSQVWKRIEEVVARDELARALDDIVDLAGTADDDADSAWRAELVKRYQTVRPFLPTLCEVVRFGAAPEGERVLAALHALPKLWGGGRRNVGVDEIDTGLLVGSWRRLVLHAPDQEPGTVAWRRAWTFCVLEQFHRHLQEGRHALARDLFHGRRGELRQRYHDGMEDQLGALGLVLNAIVLFNTRYLDAAVTQLRAAGHHVRDEDAARLSPFVRHHINFHGRYSFTLPTDLGATLRPLRDPHAAGDEDDESA